MNESPAEYGVVGHPVSHSRSPFIHGIFAQRTGQNMVYRPHDVHPDELHTFVMDFWRRGGKGLNVTVPHKISASGMVRAMSERAERAGAVNTLLMDEDGITGDNTDGAGLVRDLTGNLNVALNAARILLVGSGGAARGVIAPLLNESPAIIVIAGRSTARAESLARQFNASGPVEGCGLDSFAPRRIRSHHQCHLRGAGRRGPADTAECGPSAELLLRHVLCPGRNAFLGWARGMGCTRVAQGWGMLVEQAAESFELWRGVRPPTEPVLAALVADG
ncbi:MAG: shikimate dehydrogenase [Steroidobacteraceae bacterium]